MNLLPGMLLAEGAVTSRVGGEVRRALDNTAPLGDVVARSSVVDDEEVGFFSSRRILTSVWRERRRPRPCRKIPSSVRLRSMRLRSMSRASAP